MYQPIREHKIYEPKQFHLDPEDVFFKAPDGTKIHSWWFDSQQSSPKGTFVFLHGNAENLTSHFVMLSWLPERGYNYLIVDYPGYGLSDGAPSPEANVAAAMNAIRWVSQNKDPRPLIVYGNSMGGIVAMRAVQELAGEIPLKALIVDGTFSSFQRIGRQILSKHWLTWLVQWMPYLVLSDRWAPDVASISPLPLLVLHGRQDRVIPFAAGEKVFSEAKTPKTFLEVPEGGHGNLFWIEKGKYREPVLHWLEKDFVLPQTQR